MPEVSEMETILKSGVLAYGNYTKQFEQRLKEYFETEYLIVTNSFNTAISVTLTTLGIKPGDSIIASPMACLASTQPYLSSGLNVCWADVDPFIGTLEPDSVRKQIKSETKAIIHNHFCGYPGYIDEINAIGKEASIPVIDDGIECFGSEYKGKKIGNCGTDVTVFSLTAVRFCNCIDGGVVIFKDKRLYEKSLLIRDCGIDRLRFRDELGEISPDCDISMIGYSATMSNVNGYIGLKQMDSIDDLLSKHRLQAEKWTRFFEGQSSFIPMYRENCKPNYWVYGLLVEDKVEAIKKFRGMGYYASGVHIRNDIYSAFGKQDVELLGVEKFNNSFVALPCGWWMP
ncbi:MAG: DegT/DnrJ/EryC1/StrS family aminotransferase [Lachnospiraceae bacterium]|nr:DegT/DnrJ/EryC1/StrS family aminotransferase [Lachnospiraceae bacterium]